MKKVGTYTARGQVAHQVTERIKLFDGSFKTGYKVIGFKVAPENVTGNVSCTGILYSDDDGAGNNNFNWGDNIQIAWAGARGDFNDGLQDGYEAVDTDNLIIEDLFIRCHGSDAANINYMIFLEKYDITEWQGALAMVRSQSQNVTPL